MLKPMTHDATGREYAKYDDLKDGDCVEVDKHWGCINPNATKVVYEDEVDGLYIHCTHGRHFLTGQCKEQGIVIGCYKVEG